MENSSDIGNYYDSTVTVVATVTQTVIGPPIAVGRNPENIVITPNGKQAYVTPGMRIG